MPPIQTSVPGENRLRSEDKKKSPPKVFDSAEVKRAENGGVVVTVRERYEREDRNSGDAFPYLKPKTFAYASWDEAAGALQSMVTSGKVDGGAAAPADAPTTMGALTDAELDQAIQGLPAAPVERPDTYRTMRT